MRVTGPSGSTGISGPSTARRAGSGTFRLDETEESRPTGASGATRSLGGIDALIALQGIEDVTERRRRGVRRGRVALDALDELKVGLLVGTLAPSILTRLKSATTALRDGTGEPGLDEILGEIDLRVEVELAKLGAG